ncbi:hypothetical protein ACFQVC_26830 [Streptomyces monticola]|uniref:Uncharacterized protein n=1 Tax=Streptomyces monticola TaxID=2666263 RepID=A0ABW2JPT5_9ACTN
MNDKELVEAVRDRPTMYGLNGTYYPTATYLLGCDMARSGGLLRGFNEWLIVRKGERSSHMWVALVLKEAIPDFQFTGWKQLNHLSPEQDQVAVGLLLSLVLEFLDVRDDSVKLAGMYAAYHELYALDNGTR